MTTFRNLTTAAAALSLGTIISTAAFADRTCGDFNAMDADNQMKIATEMQGPHGGREEARDHATGEDGTEEGVGVEMSTNVEVESVGGKDNRDAKARGDDMHAAMHASIVKHCKGGDDLMLKDARHPSEDATAE